MKPQTRKQSIYSEGNNHHIHHVQKELKHTVRNLPSKSQVCRGKKWGRARILEEFNNDQQQVTFLSLPDQSLHSFYLLLNPKRCRQFCNNQNDSSFDCIYLQFSQRLLHTNHRNGLRPLGSCKLTFSSFYTHLLYIHVSIRCISLPTWPTVALGGSYIHSYIQLQQFCVKESLDHSLLPANIYETEQINVYKRYLPLNKIMSTTL